MSSLKMHEKLIFEKLFNNNGYVLDFSDSTFAEFFNEYGIDITNLKYHKYGRSKMKRLRAFWELEPDNIVSQILNGLLQYADSKISVSTTDKEKANKVINQLQKTNREQKMLKKIENDFLNHKFKDSSIYKLNLTSKITEVIEQRINEIEKCLETQSSLATIFLCGSALEGILLGIAENYHSQFISSKISPKDKKKQPLSLQNWNLSHLIEVAHEIGFLEDDVKKFSHSLRDFRNYIHPYRQLTHSFNPNIHTAKICFQVLKATIYQISKKLKES